MKNPWEDIRLNDYEEHMSLDSVRQLQAMNAIMKEQFAAYDVHTAMVLGIAGGNWLEHVDPEKYRTVYDIDINDGSERSPVPAKGGTDDRQSADRVYRI